MNHHDLHQVCPPMAHPLHGLFDMGTHDAQHATRTLDQIVRYFGRKFHPTAPAYGMEDAYVSTMHNLGRRDSVRSNPCTINNHLLCHTLHMHANLHGHPNAIKPVGNHLEEEASLVRSHFVTI